MNLANYDIFFGMALSQLILMTDDDVNAFIEHVSDEFVKLVRNTNPSSDDKAAAHVAEKIQLLGQRITEKLDGATPDVSTTEEA